jgi:thiol-disulfide isomerase/thioredoxin
MRPAVAVLAGLALALALPARADAPSAFARVFDLTGLGPKLVYYVDEPTARELAGKGPTVFYFVATWCPDCREGYEDLKANLYRLPASVSVVFVDFDTAGELKRKYGVPIQDVFVQINDEGERVKLWVAGGARALARNLVHP